MLDNHCNPSSLLQKYKVLIHFLFNRQLTRFYFPSPSSCFPPFASKRWVYLLPNQQALVWYATARMYPANFRFRRHDSIWKTWSKTANHQRRKSQNSQSLDGPTEASQMVLGVNVNLINKQLSLKDLRGNSIYSCWDSRPFIE